MLRDIPFLTLLAVSSLAAQNAPAPTGDGAQKPVAARLVCPAPDQPLTQDPATFNWNGGSQTPNFRLLLGPAQGSSENGDTSLITGTQGQFAGLPAGKNLIVTLWSYDRDGNAVQPPSYCAIKTTPQPPTIAFKDVAATALTGVSLGSFEDRAAGDPTQASLACQAQCKLNSACQGYTYYPAGNGNPTAMCDLKSQITESQPNQCCLSALKNVTPAPAPPPPPPAPEPVISKTTKAPKAPKPAEISKAAPAPAPSSKLMTGDWVNQFGGVTKIVQKGKEITGSYADAQQPGLSGSLKGTFDGQSLHGTLSWKKGSDSSSGTLDLTLTPTGRLEGTWTDSKGVSGPWNMGRESASAR